MTVRILIQVGFIVGLMLFTFVKPSLSQPVRSRVLDDVLIKAEDGCSVIRVVFTFRVQYITHTPDESGRVLLIKLRTIAISEEDRLASFQREALVPPVDPAVALQEVVYEGDIPNGPFLRLQFGESRKIKVSQGPDFRSVVIAVWNTTDGKQESVCIP